jgi:tetratricopeptide (TPR) repeat protein
MRQLRSLFLGIGLATAVAAPALVSHDAHADARSDARAAYMNGVKLYNAGDYRGAIREFSSAQSLAPADLNNYNLALCYDKLGEAEPAVQYYKSYLDKVPNTDKRAEIEASMQRLDAALKSATAKKAEEAKRAEEAARVAEAKRLEEQKKADEEAKRRADEEAAAKKKTDDEAARTPVGPVGSGSTGTPSTGEVKPTGDSQLDRVNQINIDQIRDQRVGGSGSGIPQDRRQPPSGNPNDPRVGVGMTGDQGQNTNPYDPQAQANQPRAGAQPNAEPAAPQDKPKQTPVYKKWWFWAVVGVSAYVLYSIASEDSRSSNEARTLLPQPSGTTGSGGVTLMRF